MGINIEAKRIELDGDYLGGYIDITKNIPTAKLLTFLKKLQDAEDKLIREMVPTFDELLSIAIVGWNFTDKKDKDLKCNTKNIKKLPISLKMDLVTKVIAEVVKPPKAPQTS